MKVPALRERSEDIPTLAAHFLDRFSRRHGLRIRGFTESANEALHSHSWPGNVRELQNAIERAVILTDDGSKVDAAALGLGVVPCHAFATPADFTRRAIPPVEVDSEFTARPLHEIERNHILHILELNDGNRTRTAEALQISIRTLRNKLHEYRIEVC